MRHRVIEYTIDGQTIVLPQNIIIEDVRLIVNETQKVVICSSMQKSNVSVKANEIEVLPSVCVLQPTDYLTIEIDRGEAPTELAKQGENQEATNTAIYNAVKSLPDLSLLYTARFEQNSDGDNTWTMVMPVVSGVIMNEDDTVTIQM